MEKIDKKIDLLVEMFLEEKRLRLISSNSTAVVTNKNCFRCEKDCMPQTSEFEVQNSTNNTNNNCISSQCLLIQ